MLPNAVMAIAKTERTLKAVFGVFLGLRKERRWLERFKMYIMSIDGVVGVLKSNQQRTILFIKLLTWSGCLKLGGVL